MQYTQNDIKYLQDFRDIVDYDGIKVKQQVKKLLLNNKHILHVLNNEDLEKSEAEPDDYFGVNIFPYYIVKPIQYNVQNFVTFQVGSTEIPQYDKTKKYLQITFVVFCHVGNITDKDTSLPRHDLLGALIQDQFNYTNICGKKIKIVEDKEVVVDNDYAGRQIIFEQYVDNNLVRTRDSIAKLSNKESYAKVPQSED
jgi:hypothetical protein